jgi:hypothetical protein
LELVYSVGNEHNPASPTGRVVLTIAGGAARLDLHRFGLHRRWTAVVDAPDRHRLHDALATAGFPEHQPLERLVPDSTMRSLAVTGGSRSGIVELPLRETATMPGYAEAFAWLDTVVLIMTGGEDGEAVGGADPVVVSDIRSVGAAAGGATVGW